VVTDEIGQVRSEKQVCSAPRSADLSKAGWGFRLVPTSGLMHRSKVSLNITLHWTDWLFRHCPRASVASGRA
jgi:hypothetical protein